MSSTLVLIPGLLCDELVWQPFVEQLPSSQKVFIPFLDEFKSLAGMAEHILQSVSGPIMVAGHSMGARVALEIIRSAPDRVDRLALLDTGTHGYREGEGEKRLALVELGEKKGMRSLVEPWLLPMLHPKFHRDDSILSPLVGMLSRMNSVIHRNQIEALINRQEADSVLTTIKCKTLIVVGQEDAWSPVEQHQRMHERISGSRLEVIPEAGHFAPFEQPFAVNQVLNAWLQD